MSFCNYDVNSNGGLNTSDIISVGALGGLSISEITNNTSFTFNNSSSTMSNGASIMMSFNKDGKDHAVIVTNISTDGTITYRDPSNSNQTGTVSAGQYSGLYSILNSSY
jgi:hypothetical protein